MTTFIVAINHQEASHYCGLVATPQLNPKDQREVVIFPTDISPTKVRGRRFTKEDKIIFYGRYWQGKYAEEINQIIFSVLNSSDIEFKDIAEYV